MDLLTAKEASEILKVSHAHMDKMCASGQIPAFKIGDGPRSPWRIHKHELKRYVSNQTRRANVQKKEKSLVDVLEDSK